MRRHPAPPSNLLDDIQAPTCAEHAAENLEELAANTRRGFLGGAMAAAIPSAILSSSSSARGASTSSSPLASSARYFQEIQKNEASHVQIVLAAIQSLGGTPRPYPTFQNISTNNAQALLKMATMFENTGTAAYFGASPYLYNPAVKSVTSSLAFVEAYQSGYLNALSSEPLVPGGLTYAIPGTIPEVVAAAAPFIVSLNDDNLFPPTFSTTPSPQNDIAILNFALLLEYLEATFYYNSVPAVFP